MGEKFCRRLANKYLFLFQSYQNGSVVRGMAVPYGSNPSIGRFHMYKIISLLFVVPFICLSCQPDKSIEINYLGQAPPGMQATLFAPGLISTNHFEHSAPAFSPDGRLVLWTVLDKNYRASLYEMSYAQGKWSSPHRPSFADTTADDYYPSFSADGKKLYFSSRRKVPTGYPATIDMRIWQVERHENGWGKAIPFDTAVFQGKEYAHSVSGDGTIYFASALGGGTGWNLQKAAQVNGQYTRPVLLPYSINSIDYEDGPCIAPDESFLIFESQRPEGIESSVDLYISFKTREGRWGRPVNMGSKINSASAERFAKLSPDGKYLFFGSNRNMSAENRGFDIFWIDARVINELRTSETAQVFIQQPLGDTLIHALYKNDIKTAANGLKKWLELYPGSLDATVIYSSVLRKQKQYAEAETLLKNIPSQWHNKASIVMEMALVKSGLTKEEEAASILAPLLGEGEMLGQRYIYLSNALLDMGKFVESETYFEKAMAIHRNKYEYQRRARRFALIGEKDKALEHVNKAIASGLTARQEFENDPDLASLKSDHRFQALLNNLD